MNIMKEKKNIKVKKNTFFYNIYFSKTNINILFFIIFTFIMFKMAFSQIIYKDTFNSINQWIFITDNVMGGVSSGKVNFKKYDNYFVAHLSGNVSTENNGGFIQIRRNLKEINLDGANFIKIIAKGNNQKYFVHIRTTRTVLPWQYYQSSFDVSKNFEEFILPIRGFKKSGFLMSKNVKSNEIISIGLVAFGRDHAAELYIKEVSFTE